MNNRCRGRGIFFFFLASLRCIKKGHIHHSEKTHHISQHPCLDSKQEKCNELERQQILSISSRSSAPMLPHVPWQQVTPKHRLAVTWTFPLESNETAFPMRYYWMLKILYGRGDLVKMKLVLPLKKQVPQGSGDFIYLLKLCYLISIQCFGRNVSFGLLILLLFASIHRQFLCCYHLSKTSATEIFTNCFKP